MVNEFDEIKQRWHLERLGIGCNIWLCRFYASNGVDAYAAKDKYLISVIIEEYSSETITIKGLDKPSKKIWMQALLHILLVDMGYKNVVIDRPGGRQNIYHLTEHGIGLKDDSEIDCKDP